ncbi:aTP synthase F0 C subunit [Coprobacillus sp. CAG:826]|nr:aTP synthase F0 C subunit [Coprobacillus sp. CAG:826]
MLPANLFTIFAELTDAAAQFQMKGVACIAAAIAVLGGMACAITEGLTAAKAVEGVARNPEASGKIRSTLIIGCALTETTGIYAFVIALLVLFLVAVK